MEILMTPATKANLLTVGVVAGILVSIAVLIIARYELVAPCQSNPMFYLSGTSADCQAAR
jgi:hypothetical protein